MCSGEWIISPGHAAPSAQVEPRATDTAAEGEPGAERGYEKSLGAFAEEQSGSFSYPGTTIDMPPAPLRTEWVSVFSNPYSGAMSGDEEGIFYTPNFSLCVLDQNSIVLACLSPRWQNYRPNRLHRDLAQQLVFLALAFPTMLNTLRVVMTMTTTLWNSGRGYDRHPRAEKWMFVLLTNTLCVRMSVRIGHAIIAYACTVV